jgi:hypothetical protein
VRTRKSAERSAPVAAAANLHSPRDKAHPVGVNGSVQPDGSQIPGDVSSSAPASTLPADWPPWVAGLVDQIARVDGNLTARLDQLDAKVDQLLQQRTLKDWYGTEEVAQLLGKAEFTVREWCRNGRVNAQKRGSGRGKSQSWVISQAELQRLQREGLLPVREG